MPPKRKVKPASDHLLDIDLDDVDPTETSEGKEGLNTLVSTVSSLFKADDKKKIAKRSEPSTVFSELGLPTHKEDKIEIHHLLNSVIDKSGKIKRQIRKITHKKLLPLPLDTPTAKKIERQVNYEETVKDISKWEPIIQKNREAPQLSFPLEKPRQNVQQIVEKFNLKRSNPLKQEVDELLKTSDHVMRKEKVLTDAEEQYLNQMSIEEARIRHAQLQKMRALISYREAKLKRKAKIKSKKYHKLLKKEKLRNELKEFEDMRVKNPGAALDKLNRLDKMRALERASLKHLNSGKWAKQNLLRAKYDPKTRDDIKEQMHLNRTLLQKAIPNEEEDEEEDITNNDDDDLGEGEIMMEGDAHDDDERKSEPNPWLMRSIIPNQRANLLTSSEILEENNTATNDEVEKEITPAQEVDLVKTAILSQKRQKVQETPRSSAKKIKQDTKEKEKIMKAVEKAKEEEEEEEIKKEVEKKVKKKTEKEVMKEKVTVTHKKKQNDEEEKVEKVEKVNEQVTKEEKAPIPKQQKVKKQDHDGSDEEEKPDDKNLMIDPKKILTTKIHKIHTSIPDYHEIGADAESDDEDEALVSDEEDETQRRLIAEAFDEDDVVAEFIKDKKEQIDKEKEKDVDSYLPGWGSWSGPGIKTSRRKKKKFVSKAKEKKRKDATLPNVIISENKDKAIAKYMVKELPFNCRSVEEFEKKYQNPIGPNWNPETQFRYNVAPKILTQMGSIIEPINHKALIANKSINKRRPLDQVAKTLGDVIPV